MSIGAWHPDPERPWLLPPFQGITETEPEEQFRCRLASVLRSWEWEVFCHDPGCGKRFSVHFPPGYDGPRGFVDLYCRPPQYLDWHVRFPVVGIEIKLARNLRWLRQGVRQVVAYVEGRRRASYRIAGEPVPAPTLFLLCTQDSWNTGHLYEWPRPEFRTWTPGEVCRWLCGMTDAWVRFLDPDMAILLGGTRGVRFSTSAQHPHGSLTTYHVTQ